MLKICTVVASTLLILLATSPVAADHGYWPAGGVTPADVAGHRRATAANTTASFWGPDCRTVDNGGPIDAGLDVYGAILDADYDLAVIVAGDGDGTPPDEWYVGPHAVTLFGSANKGEFVWADADGDGTFANRHEQDATLMFLCGEADLPATDAAASYDAKDAATGFGYARIVALGLTSLLVLLHAVGARRRQERGGQAGAR